MANMLDIKSLKDADIKKGTRVIVRVDFNVETYERKLKESYRIKSSLPTLLYILEKGGYIRIISHLGRPHGREIKLSLKKIAEALEKLLKKKLIFIADPFSEKNLKKYNSSPEILFFENIRFWPGEEKNDFHFADRLARWADLYVNEAFSNSHREHASMSALAKKMKSFAGLGLEREIFYLEKIFKNPQKPVAAIFGGIKLNTKMPLVEKFLKAGNTVLIGGALANAIFLKKGFSMGALNIEEDMLDPKINFKFDNPNLYLPIDARVARNLNSRLRIGSIDDIKPNEIIFDIGPETVKLFESILLKAKTIIWNGPLGFIEKKQFRGSTLRIAEILKNIKALKIVGGGHTTTVLDNNNLLDSFTHVSTGGGAMLRFLAGEKLPGVEALKKFN